MQSAAARMNHRQYEVVRAYRQEKTPTENDWGLSIGGAAATE